MAKKIFFQQIARPLPWKICWFKSHLSGNSSFKAAHFPVNPLSFETSLPLEISEDPPCRGCPWIYLWTAQYTKLFCFSKVIIYSMSHCIACLPVQEFTYKYTFKHCVEKSIEKWVGQIDMSDSHSFENYFYMIIVLSSHRETLARILQNFLSRTISLSQFNKLMVR